MTEVSKIIETLRDAFDGSPWHGPSVVEILSKIPDEKGDAKIGNGHSIIEIIGHMTAWRTYATQKLRGNEGYEVSDESNFPKETNWNKALADLHKSQTDC